MSFHIIVTVKQVPDTQQITSDAMTPEGTVNRGALPTIVNPEDLNALEEALKIKDQYGAEITIISMGPPGAAEALKQCFFRGADKAILLTDKHFAGSDTLATSYVLAEAIKKVGKYHLILCGRQAIDGDTAQVGPQIAEKLGINQISSVSSVINVHREFIEVERSTEYGIQSLQSPYPLLMTVCGEANEPRSPRADLLLGYRKMTFHKPGVPKSERELPEKLHKMSSSFILWDAQELGLPRERCGLKGSPTQVKKVENVVLETGDFLKIENNQQAIDGLVHELIEEHIL